MEAYTRIRNSTSRAQAAILGKADTEQAGSRVRDPEHRGMAMAR
jgi:hypothetical protein